jgi:hypothetical protein
MNRLALTLPFLCLMLPLAAAAGPLAGAPRDAVELEQRVAQLRAGTAPWLRSLPAAMPAKPRVLLSGEGWLRKIEYFAPKPGFFAMAQLNQLLAPVCEIGPEGKRAELWIANDLPEEFPKHQLQWRLSAAGLPSVTGRKALDVPASNATPVTTIDLASFPNGTDLLSVELEILAPDGRCVSRHQHDFFLRAWREKDAIFASPAPLHSDP